MIDQFEKFAHLHWQILLGMSLLLMAWRLGNVFLFGRWLARRFPIMLALADLVLIPALLFLGWNLLNLVARELGLTELDDAIQTGALVVGYLVGAWLLAHLIEVLLRKRAGGMLPDQVPKLVVGLIYVVLMLFGLGLFLWQQGYSFAGIWVSTGVAAGVLGLALQRTLGDLFSGIALGIERPFKLGDWVELRDGTVGQVIDLNWRATWLRGWDNATHVIPNWHRIHADE